VTGTQLGGLKLESLSDAKRPNVAAVRIAHEKCRAIRTRSDPGWASEFADHDSSAAEFVSARRRLRSAVLRDPRKDTKTYVLVFSKTERLRLRNAIAIDDASVRQDFVTPFE